MIAQTVGNIDLYNKGLKGKIIIDYERKIVHDSPSKLGIFNVKPRYRVEVVSDEEDPGRGCIHCGTCVIQCTHNLNRPDLPNGVFWMEVQYVNENGEIISPDEDAEVVYVRKILHIVEEECTNCKRCVKYCPQGAIKVYKNPEYYDTGNKLSNITVLKDIWDRAKKHPLIGAGHIGAKDSKLRDEWLIDSDEILSPQRDHRYEYAGNLRDNLYFGKRKNKRKVSIPILDVHQSYGSNSHESILARLMASIQLNRPFFTGEGFLHPDMAAGFPHSIIQFGSGGFGPWINLDKFMGFSMKYGQDAKKGKGGRLNANKNDIEIALIRCVEAYKALNSPNPQHLQYSIEELPMRVETLRALLGEDKLIGADVYGTAWNFEHIVVALAKAGFDYITIRGGDGSTGAAHRVDLQNIGLNIVYLVHIADLALRREGLREQVTLIGEGGIKDSFMAMLVLLAGADFVGIGMPQLSAMGCTLCRRCYTGQCSWGITSRRYGTRIDPERAAEYIYNLNMTWLKDMEGLAAGMGMNTHADVVGSRRFRYHGSDPLLYETFGKKEWAGQLGLETTKEKERKRYRITIYETKLENDYERLKKEIKIEDGIATIDVNIMMDSKLLNRLMKYAASELSAEKIVLKNVCGQRYIGTGVNVKEIDVYGLSGNNSFAFTYGVKVNTYPTRARNTRIPGNVQVAVCNTANPYEVNIAGEANDLFASYAVSGKFRVAKSSGVRTLLLFKAGIPDIWKRIDWKRYEKLGIRDRLDDLLRKYQKRRGLIDRLGYHGYLRYLKKFLDERMPPIGVFGVGEKPIGDYFMEYSQGGIGIVLNIYDIENPVGYYVCSGLSAGAAYIRGKLDDSRLGVGVKKISYIKEEKERQFLKEEIQQFITVFSGVEIDDEYNKKLDEFADRFYRDADSIIDEFCKVVSAEPPYVPKELMHHDMTLSD
jgi:glutamate synthase domain-containing protein 2/glutamate synthase domain-containing protein 3